MSSLSDTGTPAAALPAGRQPAPRPRRLIVLLLLAGLLAHASSFLGDFHLDDVAYILDRDRLASFDDFVVKNVTRPFAALTFYVNNRFAPLGPYTFNSITVLGGVTPTAFHVVNLAIHLLAGLALFGALRRTLMLPRIDPRAAAAANEIAFAVALLWLVHPLPTHAVTYLVQRCESLMGLLYLTALYCLIRGARSEPARVWYQLSILAALLGSATKEVMATAPPVLLVYDRIFLAASWRDVARHRLGYHVALAAACWILPVYAHFGAVSQSELAGAGVGAGGVIDRWSYLITQSTVLLHYIALSLWPQNLSFEYRDWPMYTQALSVWPEGLTVLALLALTAYGVVRGRWFGFVGAWFFGILSITSSVLPVIDPVQEYRMYLPLAAVMAVMVLGVHALLMTGVRDERGRRMIAGGLLTVVAVALGTRTFVRNLDYRSAFTLWEKNLETRPLDSKAYVHLGAACEDEGRYDEAIALHHKAIEGAVGHFLPTAEARLALLYLWKGKTAEATFLRQRSRDAFDLSYYAALEEYTQGQPRAALARISALEKVDTCCSTLPFTAAVILADLGDAHEARSRLRRGLEIFPGYAVYAHQKARLRLDNPFFESSIGRAEALLLARQAVLASASPDVEVLSTLAQAYAVNQRWRDAVRAAERAAAACGAEQTQERRQLEEWRRQWSAKE